MDISDSYEPQQQQQQQSQQAEQQMDPTGNNMHLHLQQQQPHQQQMQCDIYPALATNGFGPAPAPPGYQMQMQTAIPLPAPPSLMTKSFTSPSQQTQPPPTSTDIDIDSMLLQQFSCLGTTDHEDLISQFQSLMNNQMNKDSAKFFLEMSNWNLQTAVGCYLDFCNFQTLPSMKIIQQDRPSELQQAWRLQNDGNEAWPNGCYLMSPSRQTRRIEMPAIKPGETCDIVAEVPVTQPPAMWRMCTPNGWYFGDTIWMTPPGTCNSSVELAERMSQLRTPSSATNTESLPEINFVISVNME